MAEPIYLDRYVLQQDMRIRMPKSILANLPITKGETLFDVYLNAESQEIILRIAALPSEDKSHG